MKKAEKLNKIYENILEKIKFFINKDNFTKTKLILVAIMSVLIATLCEYTIFRISLYITEFIIIALYWMRLIHIATNTNNFPLINSDTSNMYIFIIRN